MQDKAGRSASPSQNPRRRIHGSAWQRLAKVPGCPEPPRRTGRNRRAARGAAHCCSERVTCSPRPCGRGATTGRCLWRLPVELGIAWRQGPEHTSTSGWPTRPAVRCGTANARAVRCGLSGLPSVYLHHAIDLRGRHLERCPVVPYCRTDFGIGQFRPPEHDLDVLQAAHVGLDP